MSEMVPDGWQLSEAEDLYTRVRVPRVYDRNQVRKSGRFPVIDQSESGSIGYIDEKPEFDCSTSSPITTFANHTCAVRQMKIPFGVIQNVFPLKAKSHVFQGFLFHIIRGAIQQDGYKGHYPTLRETQFLTPPKPEQQKIASILTSVDEVIDKTEAQISKLQDLKKGMMQELLTKGIGHTEFKDSPVGRIPKSWKIHSLDELAVFHNGFGFKASDWALEGLPIIRIQNLNGGDDFNYFRGEVDRKWFVPHGSLLFAWSGQRGKSFGARIWRGFDGVLNQHIFKVTEEKSLVSREFLHLALMQVQRRIESKAHGFKDSFMHVKKSDLVAECIGLPTQHEQTRIVEIMGAIESKLQLTELKLAGNKCLKKALMQDLLTGKVRVKVS